jgi:ribonuclease HI
MTKNTARKTELIISLDSSLVVASSTQNWRPLKTRWPATNPTTNNKSSDNLRRRRVWRQLCVTLS